jgi:hypothetical protein
MKRGESVVPVFLWSPAGDCMSRRVRWERVCARPALETLRALAEKPARMRNFPTSAFPCYSEQLNRLDVLSAHRSCHRIYTSAKSVRAESGTHSLKTGTVGRSMVLIAVCRRTRLVRIRSPPALPLSAPAPNRCAPILRISRGATMRPGSRRGNEAARASPSWTRSRLPTGSFRPRHCGEGWHNSRKLCCGRAYCHAQRLAT